MNHDAGVTLDDLYAARNRWARAVAQGRAGPDGPDVIRSLERRILAAERAAREEDAWNHRNSPFGFYSR